MTQESFSSKVNFKGATVTIVYSALGRRFGGYTSKSWTCEGITGYISDGAAFLFSFDKKMKFPIQNSQYALKC